MKNKFYKLDEKAKTFLRISTHCQQYFFFKKRLILKRLNLTQR